MLVVRTLLLVVFLLYARADCFWNYYADYVTHSYAIEVEGTPPFMLGVDANGRTWETVWDRNAFLSGTYDVSKYYWNFTEVTGNPIGTNGKYLIRNAATNCYLRTVGDHTSCYGSGADDPNNLWSLSLIPGNLDCQHFAIRPVVSSGYPGFTADLYTRCNGGEEYDINLHLCQRCQAGYYTPGLMTPCAACPTGLRPSADQASCVSICPPGKYYSGGSCLPCPPGTYGTDGLICYNCPAGWYSAGDAAGTTTCTQCAFDSGSPTGASTCTVVSKSGLAAAAGLHGPGTLDIFLRNNAQSTTWISRTSLGVYTVDETTLGGAVSQYPAACVTPTDTGARYLSVYVTSTDNCVWRKHYDTVTSSWLGWYRIGCTTYFAPAVVSWGNNRTDLFVTGSDGRLYHKWNTVPGTENWLPAGETTWDALSKPSPYIWLVSAPAAASWGPNQITVVAVGSDLALWTRSWQPSTGWVAWSAISSTGFANAAPAVASFTSSTTGEHYVDVFVRNNLLQLYRFSWTSSRNSWLLKWDMYSDSVNQGGGDLLVSGAPAVAVDNNNQMYLFAKGLTDFTLRTWIPSGWNPYKTVFSWDANCCTPHMWAL